MADGDHSGVLLCNQAMEVLNLKACLNYRFVKLQKFNLGCGLTGSKVRMKREFMLGSLKCYLVPQNLFLAKILIILHILNRSPKESSFFLWFLKTLKNV